MYHYVMPFSSFFDAKIINEAIPDQRTGKNPALIKLVLQPLTEFISKSQPSCDLNTFTFEKYIFFVLTRLCWPALRTFD